jgi:hypothetical protein
VCNGNFELRLTSARVIISREPRRRDLVEAAVCGGRWDLSSTAGDLVAATPLMTHTQPLGKTQGVRRLVQLLLGFVLFGYVQDGYLWWKVCGGAGRCLNQILCTSRCNKGTLQ